MGQKQLVHDVPGYHQSSEIFNGLKKGYAVLVLILISLCTI